MGGWEGDPMGGDKRGGARRVPMWGPDGVSPGQGLPRGGCSDGVRKGGGR